MAGFLGIPQAIGEVFTKMVGAVLILLLGFLVGRILGKLVQRLLKDLALNAFLKKKVGIRIYAEESLFFVICYGCYLLAIVLALNYAGLAGIFINFLTLVVLVVIVLFLLLSVKDFIPNLVVGSYLHAKRRIRVGQRITVHNTTGRVVRAGLLETTIVTTRRETIVIPNMLFMNEDYRLR